MRHLHLIGLLSIWMANVPAIGYAQGTAASNAISITLPVFQDAWMLEGKMGERYIVPIKKAGDVVWYTFKLEDDLVIYAQHFGNEENYASVELLDKAFKTIAKSKDEEKTEQLIYNGKLRQGTYFIKVISVVNNGKPFKIELCKFSKKQTEEGERRIKPSQGNVPKPISTDGFVASASHEKRPNLLLSTNDVDPKSVRIHGETQPNLMFRFRKDDPPRIHEFNRENVGKWIQVTVDGILVCEKAGHARIESRGRLVGYDLVVFSKDDAERLAKALRGEK